MRALRIIGIVIGCVVAVLIAAVIVLWLIVNPNDYKGRIETAVRSATGSDLSLAGNIHLAIFPSIALERGRGRSRCRGKPVYTVLNPDKLAAPTAPAHLFAGSGS